MSGGGYALMIVNMLLFWGLVIAGIAVLVHFRGDIGRRMSSAQPTSRTPQRILAERFARGEIDHKEYRRRIDILERGHHALRSGATIRHPTTFRTATAASSRPVR